MKRDINIKERLVEYWNIDTGTHESEIVKYLDKKMKVRFHSALFGNLKYTFVGKPDEQARNSVTVSSYKLKENKSSIVIEK